MASSLLPGRSPDVLQLQVECLRGEPEITEFLQTKPFRCRNVVAALSFGLGTKEQISYEEFSGL